MPAVRRGDDALEVQCGADWVALHSRRAPLAAAHRRLDTLPEPPDQVLAIIGLAGGHLLDALEERGWSGQVLALEPLPDVVEASLTEHRRAVWCDTGRLVIVRGPAFDAGPDARRMLAQLDQSPVVLVDPVTARAEAAGTEAAQQSLARLWAAVQANAAARRENAPRYLLNTLANLRRIAESQDTGRLRDGCKGLPAVLAAAGPSLDTALDTLTALRERAVLIAVDTAARPLLARGIEPDLIVALDPSDANARHLERLPDNRAWLVTEGSVDPHALRAFDGRLFTFQVSDHHPWPWLRDLGVERHTLRAWGSVLTAATDLALFMGCGSLIYVGADLAFPQGRPYCRGTAFEEDWSRAVAAGTPLDALWQDSLDRWPHTEARSAGGTTVRTAPHLLAFRDWIVEQSVRFPDRTFVNTSRDGVLVGGRVRQDTVAAVTRRLNPCRPLAVPPALCSPASSTTVDRVRDAAIALVTVPGALEAAAAPWREFTGSAVSAADLKSALAFAFDMPPVTTSPEPTPPSMAAPEPVVFDGSSPAAAAVRGATNRLASGGSISILDQASVALGFGLRRLLAPLAEAAGFEVVEGRFVRAGSRITVVKRRGAPSESTRLVPDATKAGADAGAVAEEHVRRLVARFGPRSVYDIGPGDGAWLRAFARAGVSRTAGLSLAGAREPGFGVPPPVAEPFDLVLLLDVLDDLPPPVQDALVTHACAAGDRIAFAAMRPGAAPHFGAHCRSLRQWTDLFLRQGFLLDDEPRADLESGPGVSRSAFDRLVVFERALGADEARRLESEFGAVRARLLAQAARLDELNEHTLWLQVERQERQRRRRAVSAAPLHLPSEDLRRVGAGVARYLPHSDALTWWITEDPSDLAVSEDGRALRWHESATGTWPPGTFGVMDGALLVASRDGLEPRLARRAYTLAVPDFIARAEREAAIR
ncbi:MAG: 6-hydroxymethylpterin diphosphokinase MptE-like protein [Vicinamibacterales bacterium]